MTTSALPAVIEMEWIRTRAAARKYSISEHVLRFMMSGKVTISQIEDAISNGLIIEDHFNPQRGSSVLILGTSKRIPVHVICADGMDDSVVILFAYKPVLPAWETPRKRNRREGGLMTERVCFFCGGELKSITVGNFDYRLKGKLYVIKKVPAKVCVQCGEKYVSAKAAEIINRKVERQEYLMKEEVLVMEYADESVK